MGDKGKGTKLLLGFPDTMSARFCCPIAAGNPESPAKPHLAGLCQCGEGSSVRGQGINHSLVGISLFSLCTVCDVGTWKSPALTRLQHLKRKIVRVILPKPLERDRSFTCGLPCLRYWALLAQLCHFGVWEWGPCSGQARAPCWLLMDTRGALM